MIGQAAVTIDCEQLNALSISKRYDSNCRRGIRSIGSVMNSLPH